MKASLKSYRRFNLMCLTVTLSGFLGVGVFNFVVDPFGITNSPIFSDFNELKIEKFNNVRLFKVIDVIRIKPRTLLLGSSRSDLGLDPNHPALANQAPYNLGLVGLNMYEVRRYFDHALANQPKLKTVVIGLDFFMFNDYLKNKPDFDENRLNQTSLTLKVQSMLFFLLVLWRLVKEQYNRSFSQMLTSFTILTVCVMSMEINLMNP